MGATKVVYSTKKGSQIPSAFNFGPGAVMVAQGIYETSSSKKARIGERLQVGDRVFRYAKNGAAALIGGRTITGPLLGGADTTLQTTQPLTVAAAAGDSRIYVNALTTAQAANAFEDGWASIYDATLASALLFRVKGNSALATSGTSSYIDLYDGVPTALTTSSQIELISNPFNGVLVPASATTLTAPIIGVAPLYVAANYYFWAQTWGPCAVISDAALDLDEGVFASDTTAGNVEKDSATANTVYLGAPIAIGTAAESSIMLLQLFP